MGFRQREIKTEFDRAELDVRQQTPQEVERQQAENVHKNKTFSEIEGVISPHYGRSHSKTFAQRDELRAERDRLIASRMDPSSGKKAGRGASRAVLLFQFYNQGDDMTKDGAVTNAQTCIAPPDAGVEEDSLIEVVFNDARVLKPDRCVEVTDESELISLADLRQGLHENR
jgi:hypothetical protein